MIEAFRTDAHPPGERTEYWVEAVRQATTRFEIRPRDDTALCGSLWAASVGEIHVGHVDAGPQRMARTRTIISDESDAPLLLSLQEAGSSVVAQGGRETLLTSGYLAVFDARRPFLRAPRPFPPERRCRPLPDTGRSRLVSRRAHRPGVSPYALHRGNPLLLREPARRGGRVRDCLPGAEQHLQRGAHRRAHRAGRPQGAAAQGPSRRLPRRPSGCLSGTTPQHTCTGGTSPRPRSPRLTACPCAICTSCSKTRTCPSAGGSTTSGWKPAARFCASRRGRLDGGRDRAEMGLRQPRALQPELSCRLRPVPWRVAPHGQRPTP